MEVPCLHGGGVFLVHTHVVPLCVQAPVRLSPHSQAVISHPSGLMRTFHAVVPWMVDPGETPAQGLEAGSVPFRQGIWGLEEGQSDCPLSSKAQSRAPDCPGLKSYSGGRLVGPGVKAGTGWVWSRACEVGF